MKQLLFISLLTLLLIACEKNVNENSNVNNTNANIDLSVREIPIKKALVFASVDQLRIRELPSLESRVLTELGEGDSLYYLNARTLGTTQIRLRGELVRFPWLKVETTTGLGGWTYGGGVRFAN
ncbi:MAG: hypothetical protein AAF847_17030 [Bacteroidota bacterium]